MEEKMADLTKENIIKSFEKYVHFETPVWVRSDLKGKHRDHCLCYSCDKFFPEDLGKNCPIAKLIYNLCIVQDLVLPVWECPNFGVNSNPKNKTLEDN